MTPSLRLNRRPRLGTVLYSLETSGKCVPLKPRPALQDRWEHPPIEHLTYFVVARLAGLPDPVANQLDLGAADFERVGQLVADRADDRRLHLRLLLWIGFRVGFERDEVQDASTGFVESD